MQKQDALKKACSSGGMTWVLRLKDDVNKLTVRRKFLLDPSDPCMEGIPTFTMKKST